MTAAPIAKTLGVTGVLFAGAIFGFFYAWVCSTMWGLDAADPRIAIAAMQAMNASVRNAVFAPAFFGTPLVLLLAAGAALITGARSAAVLFALAAAVYFGGGLILTMLINVPMNEALAQVTVPEDVDAARSIWDAYSQPWQLYNQIRTGFSGLSLTLASVALLRL